MKSTQRRFPPWLRKRLPPRGKMEPVHALLCELKLHTVCQEAHCPNMGECFAHGTATFMILGDVCTRNCTFCAVTKGTPPLAPDPEEPQHVAEAARQMGLRHVVVTSVTRDDLDARRLAGWRQRAFRGHHPPDTPADGGHGGGADTGLRGPRTGCGPGA